LRRLTAKEQEACQRLDVIMKVRAGRLTVTEAAAQLGISRQRYYEWEERALSAAAQALADREAGRPPKPADPEKEQLRHHVSALERDNLELQYALAVSRALRDVQFPPPPATSGRATKKNDAKPD
jgi:transposase